MSHPAGPAPDPGAAARVFTADDEIGRDLAAVDWAATPLGPPETWPQSLQTAVDILLSSRFSMWLAWGPDLTFFCNAAYRRDTLGRKYPWALGQPASKVWAEIWADIGPRIGTVLATAQATWDEALLLFLERSGYPEETYHTFSYSPLRDEDGKVVGMLCVVSEGTERVIGERRMATLRDLGSDPNVVRTIDEMLTFAGQQLDGNRQDLPFTLTYLFDEDATTARLAGRTGIRSGHPAAPGVLTPGDQDPVWPVAALRNGESVLVDLAGSPFTGLPGGAWDEPPTQALVVPLVRQGGVPYGFLVAALNRYRPLDDGYRGFVDLVAGYLAAGIASARSYQHQQRRAEELAELDRAKTTFFSNISHEFRTPLTLIMGPVQELQRQLADADPQVREELEVISRNGLRLGRLVNTLLDFSRIEAGRMQVSYEPVDLAQATAELASVFRSAIERAGLALEVDCPPLPEPVYVDRGMWEKVLLNLLSNALKFTFDGSVRVAVRAEGDRAVVTVADTGIGVPAVEMPRLFERFHRIENARARSNEGSGIGLALVSELIALQGGSITASSTEGEGSTFTISLPFGHAHLPAEDVARGLPSSVVSATADPFVQEALRWLPGPAGIGAGPAPTRSRPDEFRPAADAGADAGPGDGAPARVLVADDNADMREYLTRLLSTAGYQVTAVSDGQAALDAIRSDLPDLMLTDVMMPGLDGLRLVAALRADQRTASLPVVFLSARAGEEAAAAGLQAGADDYLPKPFSAVELLARVRSNLEMARFRSRESRFRRALIDTLQEGFFVTDDEGTIVEANHAFLNLVGYEAAGLPYRWPHPWVPDSGTDSESRALVDRALDDYLREGGGRYTVPVQHRDGHTVWLACSSASLLDRDGRARLFVGTARDVTSERLAAQREATLASFGAALAAAGEISETLTTAAREIAAALHARQATIALWSSAQWSSTQGSGGTATPAITSWPQLAPDRTPSPGVTDALAAARHQPAASVAVLPGPDGTRLLAAPLDGAGTSALVVEFPATRIVRAEERDLCAVLTSHLAQVLAKARSYAQARAVALTLQQAILGPTKLPHGFAARYAPAVAPLEVGGDWYDVVPVPGGRIGVLVGDCVGRGLPAAAVMGQLRSAGQAVLLRATGPAETLADLDTFAGRIPAAACTSVFCAIIDPAAATVTYSSAGHPPPILVTADGGQSLLDQAQSLPLTMLPAGRRRPQASAALAAGATLLLYTDGLAERRHVSLDHGISAAADLLTTYRAEHPETLADQITSGMMPAAGFEDDVAVLIYRQPPGPLIVHESAQDPACLARIRARLREWLAAAGIGARDGADLLIAVGEATGNAFEHSPAGRQDGPEPVRIDVTVRLVNATIDVTVTDTGTWRPPRSEPGSTRGHGIAFMHALMDEVSISPTDQGTTVTMTKELLP
ncbi:MAG TPA: SpoIIE family protein phosphatase [Streptosporangiaceae bacterium]